MIETSEILGWRGREVVASDGSAIGKLDEIYLDQETDKPEWALIDGRTFVPLTDVSAQGDDVRLPFSGDQIRGAPQVGADGELSQDDEAVLYRHYGVPYSENRSDTGLPAGGTDSGVASGTTTDDATTRSEEELQIGTRRREAGHVRLRKYIVSDDVSQTVSLQSEQARVVREPITNANVDRATSGPDITEAEHEVTLMKEEAVVDKTVVPKERIRLDKDTKTENVQVTEQVRREEVELTEGEAASGRGTDKGIDRR